METIERQGIRQMIRQINQSIEAMDKGTEILTQKRMGERVRAPFIVEAKKRLEKRLGKAQEHLETAIKIGYEIVGPDKEKTG